VPHYAGQYQKHEAICYKAQAVSPRCARARGVIYPASILDVARFGRARYLNTLRRLLFPILPRPAILISVDCFHVFKRRYSGGLPLVNLRTHPRNALSGSSGSGLPARQSLYFAMSHCRSHPGAMVRTWSSASSVM